MFENIQYTNSSNELFVINGDSPDLINDLSHKILFSIENPAKKNSFSYNISISHQLWQPLWRVDPDSQVQLDKIKDIFFEKVKRLLDNNVQEYIDITLTPLNTPKTIDEALEKLQQVN